MADELRVNKLVVTIVLFCVSQAVLAFVGWSNMRTELAEVTVRLKLMTQQLAKLEATVVEETRDCYTLRDASNDKALFQHAIEALNKHTDRLDNKVRSLEYGHCYDPSRQAEVGGS